VGEEKRTKEGEGTPGLSDRKKGSRMNWCHQGGRTGTCLYLRGVRVVAWNPPEKDLEKVKAKAWREINTNPEVLNRVCKVRRGGRS